MGGKHLGRFWTSRGHHMEVEMTNNCLCHDEYTQPCEKKALECNSTQYSPKNAADMVGNRV